MSATAVRRITLPLTVAGAGLVLVALWGPAAPAGLGIGGIGAVGLGLILLAAGLLLRLLPLTPGRTPLHVAVLAALSAAATGLGGYPVGLLLGGLGLAIGLGRHP
ncbi:hypothetical protein ACIGEZ_09030 [Streptomyces sp. NPDC085481]|uniref:hypothetical protein n=1 Tax=Streptomyces sp. NPDC085481 TaxID=3365727 RepID=UPI0037D7C337